MEELKLVPLNDGDFIPFVTITPRLGRAEFIVCPIYKRNKIVELNIYKKQQENVKHFYQWKSDFGRPYLYFEGYGVSDPKIWRIFRCKEHKSTSIELYVPNDANYIWFSVFSDNLTVGFTDKPFKEFNLLPA